jgi:hypothetical protein
MVRTPFMAGVEVVADHFNAEVDRLRSLGVWPVVDQEDVIKAAKALIARFATAGPEEQRLLRSRLNRTAKDALLARAGKLALSAVRLASPGLLTEGLAALALVDEGNDIRDSILTLTQLRECAIKLEMSPQVFAEAALFVNSSELRRRFMECTWHRRAQRPPT